MPPIVTHRAVGFFTKTLRPFTNSFIILNFLTCLIEELVGDEGGYSIFYSISYFLRLSSLSSGSVTTGAFLINNCMTRPKPIPDTPIK